MRLGLVGEAGLPDGSLLGHPLQVLLIARAGGTLRDASAQFPVGN